MNPRQDKLIIVLINILVTSLAPITFGIYYACLPQIKIYYSIELSYSGTVILPFMFGLSIFQLIYGPLSDYYGRRPVILLGQCVFIAGTIINLISDSLYLLIISRLIQGIGVGYTFPMCRAVQRDSFNGRQYFVFGMCITMVLSLVTILSPSLGAYIQFLNNNNFFVGVKFVLFYSIIVFIITFLYFRETNTNKIQNNIIFSGFFGNYLEIKNDFLTLSMAGGLIYSAEVVLCTLLPAIFREELEYSILKYGWMNLIIMSGYLFGTIFALLLSKYSASYQRHIWPYFISLTSLSATFLTSLLNFNIYIFVGGMWLFMVSSAITYSILSLRVVYLFQNNFGFASALYCSLQFLISSLMILTVHILNVQTIFEMLLCILIIIMLSFLFYLVPPLNFRKKRNTVRMN